MPIPLFALLSLVLLAAAPGHAQEAAAPAEAPGATEEDGPAGEGGAVVAPDEDISELMVVAPWPRPLPLSDGRAGLSDRVSFDVAGTEVFGTLALPPGGPAPVMLLLHGFTGTRDELPIAESGEGVYARTARLLAEAGYASLRIDFRGSGESTGGFAFSDTTFESQHADARAALGWLAAEPRVQGERPFVIGWSQGGLVAALLAGGGAAVEGVALWAAVADPQASYGRLFGAETIARGVLAGAPVAATLPWGAEVTLGQPFFEAIVAADPLSAIAAYGGPLFVAQGTEDATVEPAQAEAILAAHEGPEELWLAPMDHSFDAFDGPAMLDEMVAATVAFFDMLGAP